ncbi:MAG: homoserine kinase [Clostridiales bacterium]|jgi:homoserine kinase|nr:homoserine kinase [Clostridiales bacterium]
MIRIKIPATSANLGPGFDSIGVALSLYNYVEIETGSPDGRPLTIRAKPRAPGNETLSWYREPVAGVPTDESNLIYKSISYFYRLAGEPIPPFTITQEDYIPMDRGLGSSAACVTAGLLAANHFTGRNMPLEKLIDIAARIEGHPDNTTPALAGGMTVGVMTDNGLVYSKVEGPWVTGLKFAVFIPTFKLATKKARAVLPPQYARRDLIFNASRAALLVAALTTGDFEKLSAALEDRVHQPFRQDLVPGMAEIMREAPAYGAYNVVLSGAGPSLLAMTADGDFVKKIKPFTEQLPHRWDVGWITPDTRGAALEIPKQL